MKKLVYIFFAVVVMALTLAGCKKEVQGEAEQQLIESVQQLQSQLPVQKDNGMTLSECYYADKMLTYKHLVSADTLTAINIDSLKASTIKSLNTNVGMKKIVEKVVQAQASFRYIYASDADSISFTVRTDELQSL